MTTDPISDMLLTVRNGLKARLVQVVTPASNLKAEIARVMKAAGYIQDALVTESFPRKLVGGRLCSREMAGNRLSPGVTKAAW